MQYPTPPIRNSPQHFTRMKMYQSAPSHIQKAFDEALTHQEFDAAIRILESHSQELNPKQIQEAFRLATYFQDYDFLSIDLALALLDTFDRFDFDREVIQKTLENSFALIKHSAIRTQSYEDCVDLFNKLLKSVEDQISPKFIHEAFQLSLALKTNDLKCYLIRNFPQKLDREDINTVLLESIELKPYLYTEYATMYCIKDENTALEILTNCSDQLDAETIQKTFARAVSTNNKISRYLATEILQRYSAHLSIPCLQESFKNAMASNENKLAFHILENTNLTLLCKEFINEIFVTACSCEYSQDRVRVACYILKNEHAANKINRSTIASIYQNTHDIYLIQAIQSYVRGPGRWRRIELPARPDIETEGHDLNDVAFDVHNYTDGLDELCLSHIKNLLIQHSVKTMPFSILSLKLKITVLLSNEQDRNSALAALEKLRSDPHYCEKLRNVMPKIASFLSTDALDWHESHLSYDERWTLWLQQSFVESGRAYKGDDDPTSCPKGAYERCFSAFRGMHDVLDALFLPANLIRYYFPLADDGFDPKIKLLIEKNTLTNIIRSMQTHTRIAEGMGDAGNSYLSTQLKKTCHMFLFEHISVEAKKRLREDYGHIPSELKETISEILGTRMSHVNTKMDLFLSTLEDVDLALGTDPNNPISFLEMIHRILYKIGDNKDASFMESVIASEIAQIETTISENKEIKPFRDLIQKELEQRQYIEMRQSRKFFDLKDFAP